MLNPATLPEGMEPKDYMRICFAMIDAADELWELPTAWASKGAMLEEAYCDCCGKTVMPLIIMPWFDENVWREC